MRNEKGFTMIELVVVIVILGILAAVAVPKYVDMKTEAEKAQANGVFGAAESAAAINFSAGLLGITGYAAIADAGDLVLKMDGGLPDGWTVDSGATPMTICTDTDNSNSCTAAGDNYIITVVAEVAGTSKAGLTKTNGLKNW